ncbi:transglutaminaseTgpA domain-containing protein [Nocardioides sp. SYSU DS0663]|uniref:transglutaminase family protein n=1 Tax=Nocardioides sp. SYSU DS0663 TaxID=3416445 RepID=UPI003F4C2370
MRSRDDVRGGVVVPLVAAATTWVALLAWRPFTELPGRYLGPLAVVGLVVVGIGAFARWRGTSPVVVVLLQVLAGVATTSLVLTGHLAPIGPGWTELDLLFRQAVADAHHYAPPVPATASGVHPLLIAGGLACFLLVDVLVGTLRRLSMAGLPLLTIYSVPVSLVGDALPWWVFALTAIGFLLMLFLHETELTDRWGRPLSDPLAGSRAGGHRPPRRSRHARTTAAAVGGLATTLAVVLPATVPSLDVHLVDFGRGNGGDDEITLDNPMTDLKRDLVREDDVPVLRIRTADPQPSYLRTTALTSYEGETWSAGDRQVPKENLADGELPPLLGVDPGVERRSYDYDVVALDNFESRWLPTMPTSTRVEAEGDWRYDVQTRDFLAADDDLDTAGLTYSMTGVTLQHDAADLASATSLGTLVPPEFTELPDDLPAEVRQLALEVTRGAPTRFEKAVALQRWFRETGGFTYSTEREEGNGNDDLLAFLRSDGRVGYCEQFSAAMATMARALGIPARVAVGFLKADRVGRDTWEFSTHDLHAWPELFFPGSGWVRFEPTPSQRARNAPAWTQQVVPAPDPTGGPTQSQDAAPRSPDRMDATDAPAPEAVPEAAVGADREDRGAVTAALVALAAALVAALALLPRAVRRRRRDRRHDGGPEEAWDELRDTAIDLGLPWPGHRSPRETRSWLAGHLVGPTGAGPDDLPVALASLDRIVRAVEEVRYSPRRVADHPVHAELRTVTDALVAQATPRARRTARWWPRSVISSLGRGRQTTSTQRDRAEQGSAVVDHVGA